MKKKYTSAKAEILSLTVCDVITLSMNSQDVVTTFEGLEFSDLK